VGKNCRLHICVAIGTKAGHANAAPHIGDNCYIGPGAKIFGPIILGENRVTGANAVVNRSCPQGSLTLGGEISKEMYVDLVAEWRRHGDENSAEQ
jgi:serine O-acetyltransferase